MPYKILEHTADVKLLASGENLEDLFASAFNGLIYILSPFFQKGKKIKRRVKIKSADTTSLLIDFLNEILLLAETKKEGYRKIKITNLTAKSLEAELTGEIAAGFGEDIKAATHHEADIQKNKKGFLETKIVFDI